MSFRPSGLITAPSLYGAYLQASKPELRESATVPLWEDILNNEFKHYDDIRVNSQQSLDNTTRSADVVVRSYDQGFNPVLLLVMECKRYSRTHREIDEMELQLELYVQDYFSEFGKSQGRTSIYGAVAFGTKIRAWRFTCETSTTFIADPLMKGKTGIADLKSYRDPYIPAEADQIREFLELVRKSKLASTSQMSHATGSSSSTTNTNIPYGSYQAAAASTASTSISLSQQPTTSQITSSVLGSDEDHFYVVDGKYFYHLKSTNTSTHVERPTDQWVYNYHGWSDSKAAGRKWRMIDGNKKVTYA